MGLNSSTWHSVCTLWHCLSRSVLLSAWHRVAALEFKYESCLNLFGQLEQIAVSIRLSSQRQNTRQIPSSESQAFSSESSYLNKEKSSSVLNQLGILLLIVYIPVHCKCRDFTGSIGMLPFYPGVLAHSLFLPHSNLEWTKLYQVMILFLQFLQFMSQVSYLMHWHSVNFLSNFKSMQSFWAWVRM